jgi:hypothetical protein
MLRLCFFGVVCVVFICIIYMKFANIPHFVATIGDLLINKIVCSIGVFEML